MPTAQTLALAKQHHQAGDAQRAEPLYRQVVQAEPGNARAWHPRGAACQELNRFDEPSRLHFALAYALERQGNSAAAFAHYASGRRPPSPA